MQLSDEQRAIRSLAREFAEGEIAPHAARWDREHAFPRGLFVELGRIGLMGVCVPEELGGAGADFLSYILVLEELSRADAGVGVTVAVHTSAGILPILASARPALRDEVVPPLARGEGLAAFALTEPGAGSDAGSLITRATRDGDAWLIDGRKQWITNGSHASELVTFARTRPDEPGASGVSAFLVAGGTPGLEAVREEEKLGLNSSSTADMVYDGVSVPGDRLLGEEGRGFPIAMATLDGGRIGIAAQAVGIGQAALDAAVAFAGERETFGRKVGEHGQVQGMLAEMSASVAAARALVYEAAVAKDAGEPVTLVGAQAKLFASQVARRVTGDAIQVMGGYGYTREFPAERYYRDAKITEIYEGTSEIQRLVIARQLLGRARTPVAAG
jgi:alkylation response protein AidB-like acyl-CoA dehydrogenase